MKLIRLLFTSGARFGLIRAARTTDAVPDTEIRAHDIRPLTTTTLSGETAPLPGTPPMFPNGTNYTIIDLTWMVQVNESIPDITVTGTIEDVVSRLAHLYPEYVAPPNEDSGKDADPALDGPYSRKMSDKAGAGWHDQCDVYDFADQAAIVDGISYLRGVKGSPANGPGPGSCGRVSCSYDAGIWWCNNDEKSKIIGDFSMIADGAQQIWNDCNRVFCPFFPVPTSS